MELRGSRPSAKRLVTFTASIPAWQRGRVAGRAGATGGWRWWLRTG